MRNVAVPFTLLVFSVAGCSNRAKELFPDPKVAALANALANDDLTSAEQMVRDGVNINATGKDDITLLAWSMLVKNKKSFTWVLEHGADPNHVHGHDPGVLFLAARADDAEWLDILLHHKANPNLQRTTDIETIETPLTAAVAQMRMENLKLLIKAGADVNLNEPILPGGGLGGGTPAIDAAVIGWFEGVYLLLESGADYRTLTKCGVDLTYFVVEQKIDPTSANGRWKEKVIELLKSRGADVDGAIKKARDAEAKDRKENPMRYTVQK